jgi:hypothetical protein
MLRRLLLVMFLLSLVAGGCSWQGNSGSQAVTIDPFAWGSGRQMVSPHFSHPY